MHSPVTRFSQPSAKEHGHKYWYPTAFSHWGQEEQDAIQRVIKSGQFTMGEEVRAFEQELADYHGRKYAVMVNSGSSANLLMVAALVEMGRVQSGDLVAVPAIAWSTTYAPLVQYGLKLKVFDVDDTWNVPIVDYGPGYKLVVRCSILGSPAKPVKFQSNQSTVVIEDNCESLGAAINGKLCGTNGWMSSLSFFYSHQISAIEGGAILTDSPECDRALRMLRSHGWTKDVEKPKSFEGEYDFQCFGMNVRGVEMHAAIAREQLRKLPRMIAERHHNLVNFYELTRDLPICIQSTYPETTTRSSFGIAFTVANKTVRSKLVAALRAEDIDCRLPTGGSFRMHKYGLPWRTQLTPNADCIHETGMFLGLAPFPMEDRLEKAVNVMRGVL